MIDKVFGKFVMTCEVCDNDEKFGEDFYEMIEKAKEMGWTMRKNSQREWEHFCPIHSEKIK